MTTAGLTLRQLLTNDAESVFALRSDKEISSYLEREPNQTIEGANSFINKANDTIEKIVGSTG